MSIFKSIGDFLSKLFTSAKKVYDKLPEDVKSAAVNGSLFANLIKKYVDASPEYVLQQIQKAKPDLPITQVETILKTIATILGKTSDQLTATALIAVIQAKLKPLEGSKWDEAFEKVSAGAGAVFSGGDWYDVLKRVAKYVYESFVKK